MSADTKQKERMAPIVISVKKISKHFGNTKAVDSVSFDIPNGQIVGFVGPNGAGKTTTISMLMGFLRPTGGNIAILNKTISPQTAHLTHKSIGYVAGDMELFDNLTAQQYLGFLKHRFGGAPRQKELITRFQPKFNQKIKHLSRGNKQKIALIGAFQHSPGIAILDEPSSGLDPLMQEIFLGLIREEQARGATIFMSSHILSEVASVCDRVMFMKQGRIVTDQPVKVLEENAGKIVTVTSTRTVLNQMVLALPPNTKKLSQHGTTLVLRYDGEANKVIRWLSSFPIKDIAITERNLDDIFHEMYHEKDQRTDVS